MKPSFPSLLCLAFVAHCSIVLQAADDPNLDAVKAADEARIAAMKSPDLEQLKAIFSEDLRYAHASGAVDTKSSFIEALTTGRTKYQDFNYEERNFTFPAPGIALMTGKAHIKAVTPTSQMDAVLGFLAVWRQEKGGWHFLAWQSCKLPAAKAP